MNDREFRKTADGAPALLLVHRFYEPDVTTYSQMLGILARHLSSEGFSVDVFTTQPSYNGVYRGDPLPRRSVEHGVIVTRSKIPGGNTSVGRLLGGVWFCLLLALHAIRSRRKYDIIMVSTVPPVLMGLAGVLAGRLSRAKLVYHCMDLYPEIAIASGIAKPSLLTKVSKLADNATVRWATRTVVLSNDMLRTLGSRGADTSRVRIQNNFTVRSAPASESTELPPGLEPNQRFRILFAGNLGRFQGLDEVLRGFVEFRQASGVEAELIFLGGGVERDRLEEVAREAGEADHVRFIDHQPVEVAMAAMAASDLSVVSLGAGIIEAAYPSKTTMYLEMGCRILAVVEATSDLADLVARNSVGSIAKPGDPLAIARAIAEEYERTSPPHERELASELAARAFGPANVLPNWSAMFREIAEGP